MFGQSACLTAAADISGEEMNQIREITIICYQNIISGCFEFGRMNLELLGMLSNE